VTASTSLRGTRSGSGGDGRRIGCRCAASFSLRYCLAILLAVTLFATCGTRVAAADGWPDRRAAGMFELFADFSLEGHEPLVREMGRLQAELQAQLGVGPPAERVHMFLFQSRDTYEGYLREYFPQVPYRRALFIKGRGAGMVFTHLNPEFAIDVRHEGTHALLHSCLPMVPLWLDEGLAEYFEVSADQRTYASPHLSPVRWAARFRRVRPIEQLEGLEMVGEMGRSEYRAAWAWVHFMLHGPPPAHQALVDYLGDLAAGVPPVPLSQRLRHHLPDLEQQFIAHFRHWHE
jgi:hypothetical protein